MESKIKQKRDVGSPIKRNLQRDGQEGIEANIPRVAFTIKRLHLEQKGGSQEQPGQDYFEKGEGGWSSKYLYREQKAT